MVSLESSFCPGRGRQPSERVDSMPFKLQYTSVRMCFIRCGGKAVRPLTEKVTGPEDLESRDRRHRQLSGWLLGHLVAVEEH